MMDPERSKDLKGSGMMDPDRIRSKLLAQGPGLADLNKCLVNVLFPAPKVRDGDCALRRVSIYGSSLPAPLKYDKRFVFLCKIDPPRSYVGAGRSWGSYI